MNKKNDRKASDHKAQRDTYEQSSLNELIEQSKMVRDSISDTLTYLSMIKKDHSYAS